MSIINLIFNYDKESGKLGGNSENLKKSWQDIKDFFTKKQDITQRYSISENEKNAFAAIKERLSQAQLSDDSEENRQRIANVFKEFTGANSALVEYAQNTKVAEISQESFVQSQSKVVQGTTKFSAVMKTAGGIAKSFVATLGSMAVAAAAAWAIGKVFEGIDYLAHYDENIIKAGQEAKESIESTFSSFQDGQKSISDLSNSFSDSTNKIQTTGEALDDIAEKYTKLKKGVDPNTNENISLSTDDYQEYLNISQTLASLYPSLVSKTDAQGNAILNLGDKASESAEKLRDLYKANVLASHIDIGNNLATSYKGAKTQAKQYQQEIDSQNTYLEEIEKNQKYYQDIINTPIFEKKNGESLPETIAFGGELDQQFEAVEQTIKDFKANGIDSLDVSNILGQGVAIQGLDTLTDKQLEEFSQKYKDNLAGLLDKDVEDLGTKYSQTSEQIQELQSKRDAEWDSVKAQLGDWIQTDDSFLDLDSKLQNSIIAHLSDMDLSQIDKNFDGDPYKFAHQTFIRPIENLSKDTKKRLEDALNLDYSDLSLDDYQLEVQKALNKVSNNKDIQSEWENILGLH